MNGLLQNRWLRAGVMAGVVFAWAACSSEPRNVAPATPNLDVVLKDMNGKDVRLADFKGRPLLINFWATWCPPCKAEIPWFVEFEQKFSDQKLAVIGISVDDPAEDIRQFARERHVTYPMLVGLGHNDFVTSFQATEVIPVSWLIKRDGTVHARVEGIHPKEWFETQVKELF